MRNLQTVIFDEVGVMLKICFAEVSKIVEVWHEADAERKKQLQTPLLSTTDPGWVQELKDKYLRPTRWWST